MLYSKNKYALALLLSSSLLSAQTDLDDSLSQDHTFETNVDDVREIEIVDGWHFTGDIRAGWVEYDYKNPPKEDGSASYPERNRGHIDSKGIYMMPKLSISSPTKSRMRVKLTLAGATDFGINDAKYEKRNFVFDPTKKESFMLIQEAFIEYIDKNQKFLIGREELTTPMIDTDDWYMLANSFELGYYENSYLEDMIFRAGYFAKMAGVWDSGTNGTEFHSMSQASFIDAKDKEHIGDTGVAFANFTYKTEQNHLQIWDYYGEDMYNTLFVQYDFMNKLNSFSYDVGLQYMNFKEVGYLAGDAAVTNIDYSLYSARFDGKFTNGLDFATGVAKYSDGEGQGATLGAFGGYPYFANGMIFHFFEAGSLQNAASYKAQLGYDFTKIGLDNLWIGYRYTYFDLDSSYSFAKKAVNSSGDIVLEDDVLKSQEKMILNGIRVSYAKKSGAYFTGTYEKVNLDNEPSTFSLRLIGGYKF